MAATEGDALTSGATHTRNAWPILIERRENEASIEWAKRVQREWLAAESEREATWENLGMGRPIEPGQEFPVLSPEYIAADDRSDVLAHNMELAHAAMRADNGKEESRD